MILKKMNQNMKNIINQKMRNWNKKITKIFKIIKILKKLKMIFNRQINLNYTKI